MVDIVATDVTYSIFKRSKNEDNNQKVIADVTFGDGALTYPAGGIPLLRAQLATPRQLASVKFVDASNSDGFLYKYDSTNEKIRIYQGDNDNVADAPGIELVGGVATPAATTLRIEAEGF